jgi:uncharacterized protein (TIGR02996 family)
MDERKALLKVIAANPDEDTPRLIYADWLDEHGDENDRARAQFIRDQIEYTHTHPAEPRFGVIVRRAYELEQQHGADWLGSLTKLKKLAFQFRRGFPGSVYADAEPFLKAQAAILKHGPTVCEVHLERFRGRMSALAKAPVLGQARELHLSRHLDDTFDDRIANLRPLVRSRLLTELRKLDIHLRIDHKSCEAIAGAPALAGLKDLRASYAEIGDEGLKALAKSPYLRSLETLSFEGCGYTATGVVALARSPLCATIKSLTLEGSWCEPRAAIALAESPHLRAVETLDLGRNRIDDTGAIALAKSKAFEGLTWLCLHNNRVGSEGVRALLDLKAFPRLKFLGLGVNGFEEDGLRVIASSPAIKKLDELHLGGIQFGPEGVKILTRSRYLPGLKRLSLSLPHSDYGKAYIRSVRTPLKKHFGSMLELYDGG